MAISWEVCDESFWITADLLELIVGCITVWQLSHRGLEECVLRIFESWHHYVGDCKVLRFDGDSWSSSFTVDRKSRDCLPTFQGLKIWIGGGWASRPSIYREESTGGNQLLCLLRKSLPRNPKLFFSCCAAMSSFLLFIKWREKEREEWEMVIEFSSGSLKGASH